ncbi:DUF2066 domain-containing protein [Marinospirillum sp.]|uniref:DUF2066 domain-containing protein n=1 Tax=Marinospirillum sp. TaxID=2183934 RepID=UPI00286FFD0D|nr:DUF2066 domain-containing protein [Marinospirillum sp.]MDR9467812.1 DUF2066 domain-containing protein [Marinospirillum sp.]
MAGAQPLYADRVDNLYSLQALVPDTRDSTRAEAANAMLKRLLVRVSGTQAVLEKMPPDDFLEMKKALDTAKSSAEREEAQKAYQKLATTEQLELWEELANAQRWVSQYSYQSSDQLIENQEGDEVRAQRLELDFDPDGINRLLQRMQAPVWDASRPKTLFLIALQGRQGRYLVTPSSNQPLSKLLDELALQRGLPLVLPDEEQKPLPPGLLSDIWGGFSREILEASQAYQPDAIAVARIYPSSGTWAVNWQLFTGLDSVRNNTSAATLGEALESGVDFVAESLSERYASSPDQGAGSYRLAVSEIQKIADFAEMMSYLNELSLTKDVELVKTQKDQLLLQVDLRGGVDQLRANLKLDGRLEETSFYSLQQARKQEDFTAPSGTLDPQADVSQDPAFFRQVDAWFKWQAN